ncbi:MAG: hypothetical protein ACT4TC_13400 [Myxococcaceae bacterium]
MRRLLLLLALLSLPACKPVIERAGNFPARDICQLESEATDILLADVVSWGETQTKRFNGRRYRVTPVKVHVRTAYKGGHFGEQTVWFLGDVGAGARSASGPLRFVGDKPVSAFLFAKDTDPELFLIGGGFLWRNGPGSVKNTVKYAEGFEEKDVRRDLDQCFRKTRACEPAPAPEGLLGH